MPLLTVRTAQDAPYSLDWETWVPRERAVLTFIRQQGQILLIHKKRGLGAGKYNAPGGRMEPGETAAAAAVRETREELCVTPTGLRPAGALSFAFIDGYSLHCQVFVADGCTGVATETDEAIPFWCAEEAIPYHQMWADDRLWLPHLLAGRPFRGQFIFDGDQMLWHYLV
jgi:8-oxo-dGTP diphosphatase